jgi:hypothetical protein
VKLARITSVLWGLTAGRLGPPERLAADLPLATNSEVTTVRNRATILFIA